MMPPSVAIVTHIPSPYQVELFDAIAASGRFLPRVIYARRRNRARQWDVPSPGHEHVVHEEGPGPASTARHWISDSDLVVISHYSDGFARNLMHRRASSRRPWCLWGERPGSRWGLLGRVRRRFCLTDLARTRAPIWGIGAWAVEGWKREFGAVRRYENIPYFSNLERFRPARPKSRNGTRTILFSGSLIPRKGIDLAAEAFVRVARRCSDVRLEILGSGPLEASLRTILAPVNDRVRFLGFRQWNELPDHYRNADILCAPSRYDGWGLIVPEGLACGLPVIATDRMGAALDLIRPGENGWIVRADELESLESAVQHAVELSGTELDTMSAAAVATASRHSLPEGADRFCDAAERVIQEWPAPSHLAETSF